MSVLAGVALLIGMLILVGLYDADGWSDRRLFRAMRTWLAVWLLAVAAVVLL